MTENAITQAGLADVYAELEEAVRERDEAEAKLARIAAHCRQRLDRAIIQGPVSVLCRDIAAIISDEAKGRHHDRDQRR